MPSGKIYREFGDIKNNTIDIILPSDVLCESGKVTLEVELRKSDKVVTPFSIYLNVEKSIDGDDITDIDGTKLEDIRHFHYNKDVLDTITQEMIDKWNNNSSNKNNLSDFNNDVGFVNEQYVIDKISEIQLDDSKYATKDEIPTKTSQLANDSNFATESYVDSSISNIKVEAGDNHYLGDEEPTDENAIWFSNETNYQQQITYDNPIIQEIFSSLRALNKAVAQLQSDVEYLKIHGGGGGSTPDIPDIPDIPDVNDNYFFLLEDGGQFLCEDGSYLVLEDYVEEVTNSILTLENGSSLLLEDGGYILLEETIQEIQDSLLLLENGAQLLLENGYKIILER